MIADFVPQTTSHALGINASGNSLDNTVRFGRIMPTDWILCDIRIESIECGITQGSIHMYSRDGVLMATGS